MLTVSIAEAFKGTKPLRTGALLCQTVDITENSKIHFNHPLEIVSSDIKGKRKRCKMASRDSGLKSGTVKPQQPALFICAPPPPSESEVHPIVGEDPDDSGKLSRLGVRVENDPAIDVKGRQAGIGKDSSEKVRS